MTLIVMDQAKKSYCDYLSDEKIDEIIRSRLNIIYLDFSRISRKAINDTAIINIAIYSCGALFAYV